MKSTMITNLEHRWTIVCNQAVIDSDSNNVSLTNVVDAVQFKVSKLSLDQAKQAGAKAFVGPMQLTVISQFRKKIRDAKIAFDYKIRILNSKDEELGSFDGGRFAMSEKIRNFRVRSLMPGIPLDVEAPKSDIFLVVYIKNVDQENYSEVERYPIETSWEITSER